MFLIALTAEKESGKTTVAKELKVCLEAQGYKTKVMHFADPVYEAALGLGWNGRKDTAGRRLLQLLGKEVLRDCIDPDYLVVKMQESVARADTACCDICILDGMRFLNEYDYVHSARGFIVKITRKKSLLALLRGFFTHKHGSEHGIPVQFCDFHVRNDGTLEQLLSQVSHIVVPTALRHHQRIVHGR